MQKSIQAHTSRLHRKYPQRLKKRLSSALYQHLLLVVPIGFGPAQVIPAIRF